MSPEIEKIAVLDSGGQYCHLIARKVRELGVYAEVLPLTVSPKKLRAYKGLIISGGPASVFAPESPRPDPALFQAPTPILGICYGHQLMAQYMKGHVEPGQTQEFGRADLRVRYADGLFKDLFRRQRVWMSHGDHVSELPPGFMILGDTRECRVAAMGHLEKKYFGLQFHPEVAHTVYGREILWNFLREICRCRMDWKAEGRVEEIEAQVRRAASGKRVLFFLSGGVDSTVAYTLTVKALGPEAVHGVYVDTGFMRSSETEEIQEAFQRLGLGKVEVVPAQGRFFSALRKVVDPEQKRRVIGRLFVEIQDQVLEQERSNVEDWLLGQGTIYPDRIESGGSAHAALIKTHHNRVEGIAELIKKGRVLEPLGEFYKDEVRMLGRVLALPRRLVERHPFPGPGLAIRCLCSGKSAPMQTDPEIDELCKAAGYRAALVPIRSVGVQGDSRTYGRLTLIYGGAFDYRPLLPLATKITNQFRQTNRVAAVILPKRFRPSEWSIRRATLTRRRVMLLQEADRIVTDFLREHSLYKRVWQCPVVLAPLGRNGGETLALRPVVSIDGMTAEAAQLPPSKVEALARRLAALAGIEAVVYDLSHKPPATIEWE